MLLLDTTVLSYATGDPSHPLAASARALLQLIGTGAVRATTTPEVLQEYLHVRSRRRSREDAAAHVERFADLLSPLLVVDEALLRAAAHEYAARPTIGAFDAVLVALVQHHDELELATADRALLSLSDVPTYALAPST